MVTFPSQADAALEMERRHFHEASMQYVLLLQKVQERKKFEFVETVSVTVVNLDLLFLISLTVKKISIFTRWKYIFDTKYEMIH